MVVFIFVAFINILFGGFISAFTAKKPTRINMWASAYLVLVGGIIQIGIAYSLLKINENPNIYLMLALVLFNIGNLTIILGRLGKGIWSFYKILTFFGSILLVISILSLLIQMKMSEFTFSTLIFYTFCGITLFSVPIGVVLAGRK